MIQQFWRLNMISSNWDLRFSNLRKELKEQKKNLFNVYNPKLPKIVYKNRNKMYKIFLKFVYIL